MAAGGEGRRMRRPYEAGFRVYRNRNVRHQSRRFTTSRRLRMGSPHFASLIRATVGNRSTFRMSPIPPDRTDAPSLRSFLDELPEEDTLRIREPMELDYLPTALILELEKRRQAPVVIIERPKGFDGPVVANLFASRDRIARMVGAPPGGFNAAWVRALARMIPPIVVGRGPVHDVVMQGNQVYV